VAPFFPAPNYPAKSLNACERVSFASRVLNGGLIAVHFLPERFAEAIAKTPMTDSVFASTVGQKRGHIHCAFADYITAERW
jgi:hypothetical protein